MDPEFVKVRRSLEAQIAELPPLSSAVMRILEAIGKPDACASEVEEIVIHDPALTAKMLRVVNSAYYGLSRQISNVGQAVVILGLQQVRNITLAVAASATFKSNAKSSEIMNQFWLHSFSTSATAGVLADWQGLGRKASDEIATCALIHDIGRLFICAHFPKAFDRLIEVAIEKGATLEATEREAFGYTHAQIGGIIAERWGFPAEFVQIITEHEGPLSAESSISTMIVHAADNLTKKEYTAFEAVTPAEIDPLAQERLKLDGPTIAKLRNRTGLMVAGARQTVGVAA